MAGPVLFVCTGNTCRSPMAEALAKSAHAGMEFISRGVAASDGGAASDTAISVMSGVYGLDITAHVSRPLTEPAVRAAALILAMTESHRQRVAELFPFACDKLYTLYSYAFKDGCERGTDVADPYMGGYEVYAECAAEIKRCLDMIDFNGV